MLTHLLGSQQQLNKRNPHAVQNTLDHPASNHKEQMQDPDVTAQIWGITYTQIWAKKKGAKRKPEKNSGLYGIRILDLCDTGAALYQLS